MPTTGTLLAFSFAAFVLIAIPGPNLIYIVARGVEQGRSAALVSALGVETGTLVHVAAAAVGLSALLASSDIAFDIVRYLGAAYLVYLGVRTLRRRQGSTAGADADATGAPRLGHAYRQAVLVNVFNPKVALFFLAFLPQFIDPARGAAGAQVLVLGVVFLLVGLCVDIAYASAAGAIGHWLRRRPRALRWQRYTSGGVYLALGAAAALTGSRR
jgi:threonine/homoserine/homoserine lactone efflux protein